jgi:hypothetical protein
MDVDAEAINFGQGRCCHKIINDKKEQMMNDNTHCRRTASPVNVMHFNDEEDVSNEIADKIMPMLIQQLSISGQHYQRCGGKVLDILRSKLNLLNTSEVECSKSKKRQRTESREDAGSGGSDIIGTSFDNAEKSLDGAGLGGDADIIFGTEDCDMSTDADTNGDDLTSNMAVDEESDKNHTAVNNMPQEKLDDVGSEYVLDASLATTGKL